MILIDRPTRRRAGVFRRALRREIARVQEPRRWLMIGLLGLAAGVVLAALIARGEAAGADARAYWAAGRVMLGGGDPYHPTGPFMPYVYAPWLLPFFLPWALLPWDVAWFVWRGVTIIGLLWSLDWAYRRRPMATTILIVVLAFPIAGSLDTGNINLPLVLLLFGAQFSGPFLAGLIWATATSFKWVPAVLLPLIAPRARLWGIALLALGILLSVVMLPVTIVQLRVLFAFPQPARIDYLVFIWAAVPWFWRHPNAFWWVHSAAWPVVAANTRATAAFWRSRWLRSPERTGVTARRALRSRVRAFLGLDPARV
jgi:hypothetical protein